MTAFMEHPQRCRINEVQFKIREILYFPSMKMHIRSLQPIYLNPTHRLHWIQNPTCQTKVHLNDTKNGLTKVSEELSSCCEGEVGTADGIVGIFVILQQLIYIEAVTAPSFDWFFEQCFYVMLCRSQLLHVPGTVAVVYEVEIHIPLPAAPFV